MAAAFADAVLEIENMPQSWQTKSFKLGLSGKEPYEYQPRRLADTRAGGSSFQRSEQIAGPRRSFRPATQRVMETALHIPLPGDSHHAPSV